MVVAALGAVMVGVLLLYDTWWAGPVNLLMPDFTYRTQSIIVRTLRFAVCSFLIAVTARRHSILFAFLGMLIYECLMLASVVAFNQHYPQNRIEYSWSTFFGDLGGAAALAAMSWLTWRVFLQERPQNAT